MRYSSRNREKKIYVTMESYQFGGGGGIFMDYHFFTELTNGHNTVDWLVKSARGGGGSVRDGNF